MIKKVIYLILIPLYLTANINDKIIYLTFDDGPTYGTENVLSVINEQKVPITMFLVGKKIKKNPDTYNMIVESPYVSIANHTYSHANNRYRNFYSSESRVYKDIKKNNDLLKKNTKIEIESNHLPVRLAGRNVFRLPNLSSNDYSLPKEQRVSEYSKYDMLQEKGFFIYGWDVEWEYNQDATMKQTPLKLANDIDYIYNNNRSKSKNKIILLMHDFTFVNRLNGKENLTNFIELLKNRGWKFESINEYL